MTAKQELAILKEISRMYQNCPERVALYTRLWKIGTGICWLFILVAFALNASKVNSMLCLVIALLAGFTGGISLLFAASAKQMPLLVRYGNFKEDEIQKRVEELKDA